MQLAQATQARHCTGLLMDQDSGHVGSTPPTDQELSRMMAARAAAIAEVEEQKQQQAVHRYTACSHRGMRCLKKQVLS